jgi:hypothetical protein
MALADTLHAYATETTIVLGRLAQLHEEAQSVQEHLDASLRATQQQLADVTASVESATADARQKLEAELRDAGQSLQDSLNHIRIELTAIAAKLAAVEQAVSRASQPDPPGSGLAFEPRQRPATLEPAVAQMHSETPGSGPLLSSAPGGE